jgi:hypothetical protein
MQVLNLINQNNFKLKYALSNELGFGAHGQVFDLKNYPNRVIKLSIFYDEFDNKFDSIYSKIDENLKFIEINKPLAFAKVYDHDFIFHNFRKTVNGDQDYIIYYYIMEKLQEISNNEVKVFKKILSYEENVFFKEKIIKNILQDMRKKIDFNEKKVMMFYRNFMNSNIEHLDLHVRNIMKDFNGNFKLIDFEKIEVLKK